jgi:thiol-disulfide isomerase/thioredoxin
MPAKKNFVAPISAMFAVSLIAISSAQQPKFDPIGSALRKATESQQATLNLPVRVVDQNGKPVAKATVTPWALRCSQGHGLWAVTDEKAGIDPKAAITDEAGMATVLYPRLRDAKEQIQTIGVSLFIDHPYFAYRNDVHIDVPLETKEPYEIKLTSGVPLEIRPLVDGKPADVNSLFALWSDGRSWTKGANPEKLPGGTLRIPAMPPGKNSLLLATLERDRATHFSKIVDFELPFGEPKKIEVTLTPGLRIKGVLSKNVPRPVRQGRIKLSSLTPKDGDHNRVEWFTWVPIQADGTFVIDGWPAEERLQLIALCDGFMAASGDPPSDLKHPYDPKTDYFNRPQVFEPTQDKQIEVAMTPLVPCIATLVDEDDKPIAGVLVRSWPNVGWWNGGSQVYCDSLVRGEQLLQHRDYQSAIDEAFPTPFEGTTNVDGKTTLQLPAGSEPLVVSSEVYELPVFLGSRYVKVELIEDKTTEVTLRLQPKGTEKLGEWDKLAGVVFGCSTREGRRICALPSVQKKMDEFQKRLREAKDPRDPILLAEAYAMVADAFEGVGDQSEAANWRRKAADQAAKAMGVAEPAAPQKAPDNGDFSATQPDNSDDVVEQAGIGIAVRIESGNILVGHVLPDTPAAKSALVSPNDRIIEIAQSGEEPVSVKGMKIAEVVGMIRGPKGTIVRLSILPAGKTETDLRVVSLTRGDFKELNTFVDGRLLPVDSKAPNFSFTQLETDEVADLAKLKGRITVVEFWATWCKPCVRLIDEVQSLQTQHPEWKGQVELLLVSVDDKKEDAAQLAKEKQWSDAVVWSGPDILTTYRIGGLPAIFLIDQEGKIVAADNRLNIPDLIKPLLRGTPDTGSAK